MVIPAVIPAETTAEILVETIVEIRVTADVDEIRNVNAKNAGRQRPYGKLRKLREMPERQYAMPERLYVTPERHVVTLPG